MSKALITMLLTCILRCSKPVKSLKRCSSQLSLPSTNARFTRQTPVTLSCTDPWKMTMCISDCPTGGALWSQRDTSSSSRRRSTAPNKRRDDGMSLSGWMEDHGYAPAKSEKKFFTQQHDDYFIIHEAFQLAKTSWMRRDFDITGGTIMESFIGLQVEQSGTVF